MAKDHAALFWFRRDLRLADNPGLHAAVESGAKVVPVFIYAPDEEGKWEPGAASRWWLHYSLQELSERLARSGSRLILRQGDSLTVLRKLIEETGATQVFWNRRYEPACIERDKTVKAALKQDGVEVSSHNSALLLEPWEIQNQQGKPFRVFTPFWRACQKQLPAMLPLRDVSKSLRSVLKRIASEALQSLDLLPHRPWDKGMKARWTPGETGALKRLDDFRERVGDYLQGRDRPDFSGTSSLSPHLHFGEIGPRQILAELGHSTRAEGYIRQIGWREFSYHLLYHMPHTAEKPLDERFEKFSWAKNRAGLRAWQRGRTGVPLVDAGMRELWHDGWMHNRVRMVVASFLTKNLRLHWLEGARWFWDTLVDADLANNTMGWQWTAGCGADAAPYFRIFNPVSQADRYDPERAYIRKWVPELARLPDRWIHQPWTAPDEELSKAGIKLGKHYPLPIADLKISREDALSTYKKMK